MGDAQRAKSGPRGRRAGRRREARISGDGCSVRFLVRFLVEEGSKRTLPAFAKSGNAQSAIELFAGMSAQIEHRVNFGDGHVLRAVGNFYDLVTGFNLTVF